MKRRPSFSGPVYQQRVAALKLINTLHCCKVNLVNAVSVGDVLEAGRMFSL